VVASLIGTDMLRIGDPKFLRGQGRYIDDISPSGCLHVAFVRAPVAHGYVRAIDLTQAKRAPGFVAAFSYADLGPLRQRLPLTIPNPGLSHPRTQFPLVSEKVRFAGEPVVMIVAESREQAEDIADVTSVDFDDLTPLIDPLVALDHELLIHDGVVGNRAAVIRQTTGDCDGAFTRAEHTLSQRIVVERSAGMPLETRGVVALYDDRDEHLLVYDSTQSPSTIKAGLCALLRLPEHLVTVVAPHVGGGFGTKLPVFYPEEVLIPFAVQQLGKPVKWIEDRREHFVGSNHERRQVHDVEIAFNSDGRILGLRDSFVHDSGAYCPYGVIVPLVTVARMRGPYDITNYEATIEVVYTNTQPVSPYRGAGGPQGTFVMERAVDLVARRLGIDRKTVRSRNLIGKDAFPYHLDVIDGNGSEVVYDSGDYQVGLDLACERIGYGSFETEREEAAADGRLRGIGIACYVEGTGYGPYEGVRVHVETSGKIHLSTGITDQGQSHSTVFAQIAAEVLGVSTDDVVYTSGDTRAFRWATGTFASRSAVVVGMAVARASETVRTRALEIAGNALEVAPEDLYIENGVVRVRGTPDAQISLKQIAVLANPLRYAFSEDALAATQFLRAGRELAPGAATSPGLEATAFYAPERATYANGVHAAVVEVDPELGRVHILRYVALHDCGRMINPAVVEGQIHGGIAQGIGGALYERMHHDLVTGQLLNANFMDFLMPYATEIPELSIVNTETPSPLNDLGIKGAGEAGAIASPAAIISAISDAIGKELMVAPVNFELILAAITGDSGAESVEVV
jgi:aerobic carbon-monoxide dehydrogenase large subunit